MGIDDKGVQPLPTHFPPGVEVGQHGSIKRYNGVRAAVAGGSFPKAAMARNVNAARSTVVVFEGYTARSACASGRASAMVARSVNGSIAMGLAR